MTDKEKLQNEINAFCIKTGMSQSGFGRWALNNPNFMEDMGKPEFSPLLRTASKIRNRIKNYKEKK